MDGGDDVVGIAGAGDVVGLTIGTGLVGPPEAGGTLRTDVSG